MVLLMMAMLACSGGGDPTPAATGQDPCCDPGEPGATVWDQCQDRTVLEHVCNRAEICCTVQWAEPCASGYARFASTCEAAAGPAAGAGEGGPAAAGDPASEARAGAARGGVRDGGGLQSVEHAVKVPVHLVVDADPPLAEEGSNIFYAGFVEVDLSVGLPAKDSRPADFGTLGMYVQALPLEKDLELVQGLHYFVMSGFGEHPNPGDRMAPLQEITGPGPVHFTIEARTIPRPDEVPEGGYAPGTEPPAPDDAAPPPPPEGARPGSEEERPPGDPEEPPPGGPPPGEDPDGAPPPGQPPAEAPPAP